MSNVEKRLKETKRLFELMCEVSQDTYKREDFYIYLNQVIISARTVTWVLQKEFSSKQGFADWYSKKKREMKTEGFHDFVMKRNILEKEGEPITKGSIIMITPSDPSIDKEAKIIGQYKNAQGEGPIWGRMIYNEYFGGPDEKDTDVVVVLRNYLNYLTNLVNEAVKKFGSE